MKSKGFTLIELLVVVTIIGVLATMIIGSLNSARSKARDAQREQDIKSIQNALELYYIDNGKYPTTSWRGSHTANWASFETLVGTTLPKDPLNESASTGENAATTAGNYVYSYFGHSSPNYCAGQAYLLVYNKENSNGTGPTDGVRLCDGNVRGYNNAFTVGVSPVPL